MILSVTLIALACALFLLGGYMVGVRRALDARDALRVELEHVHAARGIAISEVGRLEGALAQSTDKMRREALAIGLAQAEIERLQGQSEVIETVQGAARREVQSLRERIAVTEAELVTARAHAQRLEGSQATAQTELEAARAHAQRLETAHTLALAESKRHEAAHALTLAENKRLNAAVAQQRNAGRDGLREVERILSPLLEKERVAQAIQHIDLGRGTREELPRLLDAIAQAGGLSTLVLSDDSGLPLAASAGAERAEVLAGVWSQLLTLADRVVENGAPAPMGVRVLDVDGRVLAHRIFSAGAQRFLLTAVSRTGGLSPEALEPAVAKLERVLMRDAWQE